MAQHRIALLIAAHNEAVVIEGTLQSAITAGLAAEHIYVVDDNSSDKTAQLARNILPSGNVCKVRRSGKGLAIKKASRRFKLSERYRWIHIADADGRFAPDYFTVMRRELRVQNAAATGYIHSLKGRYVSSYRVLEYTVGMEVHRRIQSTLNVISIIPGPSSCFRADVFAQLDFNAKTLTEDFDVTLQIYRKNLGKIQFIPEAHAHTQDPYSLKDYIKQVTRWNRGILQVMLRHKSLRSFRRIDFYLNYQVLLNLLAFVNFFIWIPYLTFFAADPAALSVAFLYDVLTVFVMTLFAASRVNRYDILAAFPLIYGLRWLSLVLFIKAYVEVVILRRFRLSHGVWQNSANRRYNVSEAAEAL